jgi:hypothetical protein
MGGRDMAATLSIPFNETLSIGEQVRWARQRRRRRTVTRRAVVAAFAAVMLAGTLGVLLRPSDSGWSLAVTNPAGASSLSVSAASRTGATFTGQGIGQVTSPALFAHGQKVVVFGGGEPRVVTADDSGRIRFTVDLSVDRPYSVPHRPSSDGHQSTQRDAFVTFLPGQHP